MSDCSSGASFAYNRDASINLSGRERRTTFAPAESRALYAFRTHAGARRNRGRDDADLLLRTRSALPVARVRGRVRGVRVVGTRRVRARVVAGDDAVGACARGRGRRIPVAVDASPRVARACERRRFRERTRVAAGALAAGRGRGGRGPLFRRGRAALLVWLRGPRCTAAPRPPPRR